MRLWQKVSGYMGLQAGRAAVAPDAQATEAIRTQVLQMLGPEGCRRFPETASAIRFARDAVALWYLRPDIMQVVSVLHGEAAATAFLVRLDTLFPPRLARARRGPRVRAPGRQPTPPASP